MSKQETKTITWSKFFPFLEWIGQLKKASILKSDIIAGLTVAFVLVPQSMAYAELAGLPLEIGLYTAFIPVLVAGLFGSSRQTSTGPVTIISLMTATALATIPGASMEAYIVYASLLAFFIGLFYILLASLRLGVIVEFLSHPVILGFTNAVALITIYSQADKIIGINNPTLIFGISSIALLVIISKIAPKLPRVLILLIISITVSKAIGFEEYYGGNIIRDIPNSLPSFSIPFLSEYMVSSITFEQLLNLGIFAIIIGLIGFTESISVAKFVATKTKQKVLVNRELIGQGLANISSSLFGGFGVAGSFSKTAVNIRAGAKTGFASVVTGIMVAVTILFLTPYLYHLPTAVLAAIIIVAVADLIKIKPLIKAYKTEKHDGIVGLVTFALTLFLSPNIEMGILIGVILSLMFYISRSMRPKLIEVSMYKDGLYRDVSLFGLKPSKDISVFRFDGVLYFANAGHFEDKILEFIRTKEKLQYVIIDLEWMADIDSSGSEVLETLIHRLNNVGIKVYLTSLRVKVIGKLENNGFLERIGKKSIFIKVENAIKFIEDKKGDDVNIKPLEKYSPKKKKNREGSEMLEKYERG